MVEFKSDQSEEVSVIEALFVEVFTEWETEEEGLMIGKLVRELMVETSDEDRCGFVGVDGDSLVASILLSRLCLPIDVSVFLLAPVAVRTVYQGRGIGQRLINHGLGALRDRGVKFVITYGDPRFYKKVGFCAISPDVVIPPFVLSQPEGWLGQALQGDPVEVLAGKCSSVPAFDKAVY